MRAQVCSTLQIITEALNDKYSGLSASLEPNKSDGFQYLVDCLIPRDLAAGRDRCFVPGQRSYN